MANFLSSFHTSKAILRRPEVRIAGQKVSS
jgi:hypothetical protein